ncbi:MAG: hypothetical protein SVT52_00165 [Planctomycetota bacterium]|nr:hypothetical protein [Planctomycetota bacterium]
MINRRPLLAAMMVSLVLLTAWQVFAQEVPPAESKPAVVETDSKQKDQKLSDLWDDLLHYIKIARADLARSYGQAILESGAEPRELYLLAANTAASQTILARGARLEGMKEIVANLSKMIEQGYEVERASPEQIAKAIKSLGAGVRSYEIGARRLERSGEYALPQLVHKLMNPNTSATLVECILTFLPRLSKEAVRPLSVALQTKDPRLQEIFANALGRIGYPIAAPRLKELMERKGLLDRTRRIVQAALIACGDREVMEKSTAWLYYDLALKYYYQAESVVPDVRYDKANVWYWQEGVGLTYKQVPREIFCDIYAMRMARLALEHDSNFYPAVSLWLAANLKKQADLPAGATDPTRGENQPSAQYYALASSPKYLQHVLARALRDRNSAVAIGAIEAMVNTSGSKSLVKPVAGGAQPLVEALSYPDRQVRFLAAVSLADAMPEKHFNGYQIVMPVLAEAMRQTGQKTAMLVVADEQQRNILKDALRAAGYTVIDEPNSSKALTAARSSAGVDVAVLAAKPEAGEVVAMLRREPNFLALPVVIASETATYTNLAKFDKRIVLMPAKAGADAVSDALKRATGLSGKPMAAEQATQWVVRAAESIRQLGLRGNRVYNLDRARPTLTAALSDSRNTVQVAAARALAVLSSPKAQQAICALGAKADADEAVRIEALKSLGESLRRFGMRLPDRQSADVLEIVTGDGSENLRKAAAQALGAMNLPSDKIQSLILGTAGND